MIRVVLDMNVLVSALLRRLGPSAHLLLLALNGSIRLCMTGSIYAEYEEVISRPRFRLNADVIAGTLQAIREAGVWVRPEQPVRACSDPDDDIFLECAHAARAEYLVTGNLKHFPPLWIETRIVSPRWLLDNLSCATPPEKK